MAKEKQIKDIRERVKSFEDALAVTGRPALPDFSNVPADLRDYFEAQYKVVVIAEALNEGWTPDWTDHDQDKWFPWFHHPVSSSGFVFSVTHYHYSYALAGAALGFALKTASSQGILVTSSSRSGIRSF